jgi:hypothetical protein
MPILSIKTRKLRREMFFAVDELGKLNAQSQNEMLLQ